MGNSRRGKSTLTQKSLAGKEIYTLAKQLGSSAQMIEQYYSKLTATLAAEMLASVNSFHS
jgi:hypothetical protein